MALKINDVQQYITPKTTPQTSTPAISTPVLNSTPAAVSGAAMPWSVAPSAQAGVLTEQNSTFSTPVLNSVTQNTSSSSTSLTQSRYAAQSGSAKTKTTAAQSASKSLSNWVKNQDDEVVDYGTGEFKRNYRSQEYADEQAKKAQKNAALQMNIALANDDYDTISRIRKENNLLDDSEQVGYLARRAAGGFLGAVEGIGNFAGQMFSGTAPEGYDYDNPVMTPAQFRESISDYQPKLNFAQNYEESTAKKLEGKNVTQALKIAGDVTSGVTGMVPSIAANLALPGSSLPVLFVQSAGNASSEAVRNGAHPADALGYGLAVGTVEVLTEKMFDGVANIYGKGAADDLMQSAAAKISADPNVQKAFVKTMDILGEGFEEFVSEFADYGIDKVTVRQDDRRFVDVMGDAGYSFLVGALTSAVMEVSQSGRKMTPQEMANEVKAKVAETVHEEAQKTSLDNAIMQTLTEKALGINENQTDNRTTQQNLPQNPISQAQSVITATQTIVENTQENTARNAAQTQTAPQTETEQIQMQTAPQIAEEAQTIASGQNAQIANSETVQNLQTKQSAESTQNKQKARSLEEISRDIEDAQNELSQAQWAADWGDEESSVFFTRRANELNNRIAELEQERDAALNRRVGGELQGTAGKVASDASKLMAAIDNEIANAYQQLSLESEYEGSERTAYRNYWQNKIRELEADKRTILRSATTASAASATEKASASAAKALSKEIARNEKAEAKMQNQFDRALNKETERNARAENRLQEKVDSARANIAKLKENFSVKTNAEREAKKASGLRNKITKHANELSRTLLNGSDKRHIPQGLRGAVAEVLSSINRESNYSMDFTPDANFTRVEAGEGAYETAKTEAFRRLKQEYQNIIRQQNSDSYADDVQNFLVDPDLLGDESLGYQGLLDECIALSGTPIQNLNSEQLDTIWRTLRAVEGSVRNANKIFSQARYQSVADASNELRAAASARSKANGTILNKLAISLYTPYTFFSRFGDAGKNVWRSLRNAQDSVRIMQDRVIEDTSKIVDGKTAKKLGETVHNFTTEAGDTLTLTTANVMDLYNIARRGDQGLRHLLGGGVVQPEVKVGKTKVDKGARTIQLTDTDLNSIFNVLSDEEISIAEKLSNEASTVGAEYGNKASMEVFNYEKFNEENYWPITSWSDAQKTETGKGGNVPKSIANSSFAFALNRSASNAIEIGNVFDTYANHMAGMIDYAAWLAPMQDMSRILNFKWKDANGSVTTFKSILEQNVGRGARQYLSNLIDDIQNGTSGSDDSFVGLVNSVTSKAKGAAVGANLRVVIQQPTAILRALALSDAKDISRGLVKGVTKGNGWAKALMYAPIARIKDAGGFDQGSVYSFQNELFDNKNAVDKINDAAGFLAGKADAVTWGKIWNAMEWQTVRENPGVDVGSEEFYKIVAQNFTNVIDQTQVVDGILQRSQIMRSKDMLNKLSSSFMGEPTMSLNLLIRNADDFTRLHGAEKKTAAKNLGRAAIALAITDTVNGVAQSLIDGIRRDDRDKDYWERFAEAFTGISGDEKSTTDYLKSIVNGNVLDNMNPLQRIPYVKDIWSLLNGYDTARLDTDMIGDLINAGKDVASALTGESTKTTANTLNKLLTQTAKFVGIPIANLERDVFAITKSIFNDTDNYRMQYEIAKLEYEIGNEKNVNRFADILYDAYMNDKGAYDSIYKDMVDSGVSPSKIESRMTNLLKKNEVYEPYYLPEEQKRREVYREAISSERYADLPQEVKDKAEKLAEDYAEYVKSAAGGNFGKAGSDTTKDFAEISRMTEDERYDYFVTKAISSSTTLQNAGTDASRAIWKMDDLPQDVRNKASGYAKDYAAALEKSKYGFVLTDNESALANLSEEELANYFVSKSVESSKYLSEENGKKYDLVAKKIDASFGLSDELMSKANEKAQNYYVALERSKYGTELSDTYKELEGLSRSELADYFVSAAVKERYKDENKSGSSWDELSVARMKNEIDDAAVFALLPEEQTIAYDRWGKTAGVTAQQWLNALSFHNSEAGKTEYDEDDVEIVSAKEKMQNYLNSQRGMTQSQKDAVMRGFYNDNPATYKYLVGALNRGDITPEAAKKELTSVQQSGWSHNVKQTGASMKDYISAVGTYIEAPNEDKREELGFSSKWEWYVDELNKTGLNQQQKYAIFISMNGSISDKNKAVAYGKLK